MSLRHKIAKWVVHRLGGYYPPVNPHDVLDARISHLFSTIKKDDLLRNERGVWYSDGRVLTEVEVRQIKAEARMLINNYLWQELQKDIEYHAYKYIFEKSRTEFDLIGGKFLKLYVDIINTRLKDLSS
jgi:hypothetical protein